MKANIDKVSKILLLLTLSQKKTSMKCTCKGHTYERPGRWNVQFLYAIFHFDVCGHNKKITPYYLKLYFAVGAFL